MKGKSKQTNNQPNLTNINQIMSKSFNTIINLKISKEETPRYQKIQYQSIKGHPHTPNKIQLPINSIIRPLSPLYKYTEKSNRSFNFSKDKKSFSGNKNLIDSNPNSQLLKPSRIAVARTPTVKSRRYLRLFQSQGGNMKGGTISLETDYFKKHLKEINIIQRWWKTLRTKRNFSKKYKIENYNTTGKKTKDNQVKTIVIKKIEHKVISPEKFLTKSTNKFVKYRTKDDIKINLNEIMFFPEKNNKNNNNNLSILKSKITSNKEIINNNSSLLEMKPSFRQSFIFKNKQFAKEFIKPVKQFEETICFNNMKYNLNQNHILKYQKESELFFEGIINNKSKLVYIEQSFDKQDYDKFINNLNLCEKKEFNIIPSIKDDHFKSQKFNLWNNNKDITKQTNFSFSLNSSKEKKHHLIWNTKQKACSLMFLPNEQDLKIKKSKQLQLMKGLSLTIVPSSFTLISNNKLQIQNKLDNCKHEDIANISP